MNLSGAEKLSDYLGEILSEEFQVPDRRGEKTLSQIWEQKIVDYETEIDVQCKQYGVTLNR